jgi:uncharacterized membrane protein
MMPRSSETPPGPRRGSTLGALGRALLALGLAVAYPFGIWAALRHADARLVGGVVGAAVALRGAFLLRRADPAARRRLLGTLVPVAALVGLVLVTRDARALLFLPVLISAALGFAFARTLRRGPSLVETFARLHARDLTPEQVRYCWRVTGVWVAFFVLNGGLTAWLAIFGPLAWWALWTGLLSYVALGSLFAGELTYRYWRHRRYDGLLFDPLFRRIFPPPAASDGGGPSEGALDSSDGSAASSPPAR